MEFIKFITMYFVDIQSTSYRYLVCIIFSEIDYIWRHATEAPKKIFFVTYVEEIKMFFFVTKF